MATTLVPPTMPRSPGLDALRGEVRGWLADQEASGAFTPAVDAWLSAWDEDFSRAMAAQGWLGMTIPTEYGGHGRSHLERFVVTEEVLAAGAPVAAHWIADRQAAPTLLRFGTQEQKERYLPRIAAGECSWAIGMSEPDSGSDLASVRTRATRVDGGWRLDGTKVWTSGAHLADAFFALARTAPLDPGARHTGLSQFIVDLRSPGVRISPIVSMSGVHHFNEVHFDGVVVPDAMVLGEIGNGWQQVTSELGYERSGPERFLSTVGVYAELVAAAEPSPELGRVLARMRGLHEMSYAVAGALSRGEPADTPAAVVKVLGTGLEGDIVDLAQAHLADPAEGASALAELVHTGLMQRPGFTLRGGTSEILRGVVARGLGLR